jgi:hypothetical protein
MFRKTVARFSALIAFALIGAASVFAPAAFAATPNYPLTSQVEIISLHISGQYTATTTSAAKFTLPFKAKLIGVSAFARASGGTTPTLTVDLKLGATSVLSTPINLTAGTVTEGAITTATLPDESSMGVDLTIGGTSPTWNDMTVLITVVRI